MDENGTMALMVLPPERGCNTDSDLRVPVTDYGKFVEQF